MASGDEHSKSAFSMRQTVIGTTTNAALVIGATKTPL
jgi:hypothetical protein